jgi:hypothetical protein
MYTPWGYSQTRKKFVFGIYFVTTASHGGWMIDQGFADCYLSEECLNYATSKWGNEYYCFEEDTDALIVFYELSKAGLIGEIYEYFYSKTQLITLDNLMHYLFEQLSRWHPQYLLDIGEEPEPEGYARWLFRQAEEQLRKAKSDNLIISAEFSPSSTKEKPLYIVTTAANNRYEIEDYRNLTPNLLESYKVLRKLTPCRQS